MKQERPQRPSVVALTGVPGSGKTTIARAIGEKYGSRADEGLRIIHLNDFARDAGLLTEVDEARGSFVVDMDELADRLNEAIRADAVARVILVEGHFAHEMDADSVVLLRCDPRVLTQRLRARGWREEKVRENVEAEALDVLAAEVLDAGLPAAEVDVTGLGVDDAAEAVWGIVVNDPQALKGASVGTARWSLESVEWF